MIRSNSEQSPMVRKLNVLTTAACLFFAAGAARAANITNCHPITASGSYSVPAGTTLSISSGDCLDIKAPNVDITVNDHVTIKGGGTGGAFMSGQPLQASD